MENAIEYKSLKTFINENINVYITLLNKFWIK